MDGASQAYLPELVGAAAVEALEVDELALCSDWSWAFSASICAWICFCWSAVALCAWACRAAICASIAAACDVLDDAELWLLFEPEIALIMDAPDEIAAEGSGVVVNGG